MTRPYVTIVSGAPRSGTSLLMRMLEAGGIPALSDHLRPPDEYNPHGYFEDSRVRRLAHDNTWMPEAIGKSLKVIYRLLPHLPPNLDYRILFIDRDPYEVWDSQQKLLISAGHPAAEQARDHILQAMEAQIAAAKQALLHPLLNVRFADILRNPAVLAVQINTFLDGGLNVSAMVAMVDPALYRNRSK